MAEEKSKILVFSILAETRDGLVKMFFLEMCRALYFTLSLPRGESSWLGGSFIFPNFYKRCKIAFFHWKTSKKVAKNEKYQ